MGRLFRFSTPDGENVALSNANSGNNTICKGGVIGIGNDSAADAVVLKKDCGRLAWTVSVDRDRLPQSGVIEPLEHTRVWKTHAMHPGIDVQVQPHRPPQ